MDASRRAALRGALFATSLVTSLSLDTQSALAQTASTEPGAPTAAPSRPPPPMSTSSVVLPLWPKDRIPGAPGAAAQERTNEKGAVTHVVEPRLVVYPAATRHDRQGQSGLAVMVCAGGGYAHIERGLESTPACRWLQSIGVTAFELIYRLPGDDWALAEPRTAPLQDGQRAMRIIRSLAGQMAFDDQRIGVLGFSAGGHLAGITAATADVPRYDAVDAVDTLSSAPNFAALIYPVLTLVAPFDQTHTRRSIVGLHPGEAEARALSVDLQVTASTPPTFLAQAVDDPISPVDNSLRMFNALRAMNVRCEMHLFQSGGHGWGMGKPGSEPRHWPTLFTAWARLHGLSETGDVTAAT